MEANIIFENVKAYNVVRFDVRLQEEFKVELVNVQNMIRWFSDNDSVLQIDVAENGELANMKATGVGKSEVQLQSNGGVVMTLQVEVYDQVAVALNPMAGEPELK